MQRETQINVRIDAELRERLERLAREDERPLSAWVRLALRDAARRAEADNRAA